MATQTRPLPNDGGCEHEQAWHAFFQHHGQRVQVLCQWMTEDSEEAQDLASWIWNGDENAKGGSAPPTREKLLRALAVHFRPLFRHADPAGGAAQRPLRPVRATGGAAGAEARGLAVMPQTPVKYALAALSPTHRLIYLLHELETIPLPTVAQWLEVTPRACAGTLHQARVAMRRHLGYAG